MNKRTKALSITWATKKKVYERQHGMSLFSNKPISINECCCHYIPRSKGGLGIEENIVGMTPQEHMIFDNNLIGSHKEESDRMRIRARNHLMEHYEDWKEEKLIWKK